MIALAEGIRFVFCKLLIRYDRATTFLVIDLARFANCPQQMFDGSQCLQLKVRRYTLHFTYHWCLCPTLIAPINRSNLNLYKSLFYFIGLKYDKFCQIKSGNRARGWRVDASLIYLNHGNFFTDLQYWLRLAARQMIVDMAKVKVRANQSFDIVQTSA